MNPTSAIKEGSVFFAITLSIVLHRRGTDYQEMKAQSPIRVEDMKWN